MKSEIKGKAIKFMAENQSIHVIYSLPFMGYM